jgi:hypothetical protein
MGTTLRYLAVGDDQQTVLDWFRVLDQPPAEIPLARGIGLHFVRLGPLIGIPTDARDSPVVTVFPPRRRRGVLWTVGEVHFLSPSGRFRELDGIKRAFRGWLAQYPCVFDRKGAGSEWHYFLEGSIKNYDPPVFALPGAMAALRAGQYFVCDDDPAGVIDPLCKALRLRGIEGILSEPS